MKSRIVLAPNPAASRSRRPIARSGIPAGRYLRRPSQITRRAPTKRLQGRRRVNLAGGREGFFPNPGRAFEALYGRGKSHKTLRRAMPRLSKAEHEAKAIEFAEKAARLKTQWGEAQEAAHRRRFGKAPEFHDYKISGIGRDEYSAADKNKLRGLAQSATKYNDASMAHWLAARKTVATWRKMRDNLTRQITAAERRAAERDAYHELGLEDRGAPISKRDAYFEGEINPTFTARYAGVIRDAKTRKVLAHVNAGHPLARNDAAVIEAAQKLSDKIGRSVTVSMVPVKARTSARMKKNPAPHGEKIAAAARRFSRFTGHKAERVENLPFPENPGAGLAVGPVLMIGYSAMRDGQRNNYLHKFAAHARPLLVASHNGKQLYLVGGRYKFTERGIVDQRA